MIIGILGGIGAGKSTIVRMLSEEAHRVAVPRSSASSSSDRDELLGEDSSGRCAEPEAARRPVTIIDADALAHEALETPEVRARLEEWLGPQILKKDDTLDRQVIAQKVFSEPKQLKKLEDIVHPLVRQSILEQLERFRRAAQAFGPESLCILDVPLLASSPLLSECDELLFVKLDQAIRERRVMAKRSWSREELRRRESHQVSPEAKQSMAHVIIDNSGSEEATQKQVVEYVSRLMQRFTRQSNQAGPKNKNDSHNDDTQSKRQADACA